MRKWAALSLKIHPWGFISSQIRTVIGSRSFRRNSSGKIQEGGRFMILGYALRKFARELGIEKHRGVACGIYKNYPVSMWEGIASKSFCISGQFDAETRKTVESRLSDIDLFAYRVLFYDIEDMWIYFHLKTIQVPWRDSGKFSFFWSRFLMSAASPPLISVRSAAIQ